MKKVNDVEWMEHPMVGQLDGSVTVDLHLRSEKGNRRVVRIKFDQHDMRDLARNFHEGLKRVEYNLQRTRDHLAGEQ
jgi:hypothetical protein